MRRGVALVLLVALVGCSGDDAEPDEAARSSTTTTAAVTTTTTEVERDPSCTPGEVRPEGEVTYLAPDGRVVGVAPDGSGERCLADGQPATGEVVWSGTGANVILPSGEVVVDGAFVEPVPEPASWSAPTGTSIIWRDGDTVLKRRREEQGPIHITFVDDVEEVLYHPAGRAIVAVGGGPLGYGIYLGSNDGQYLRELVVGAHADGITDLTWTRTGALMFVGIHGEESHVHRLELGAGELATLAVSPSPITGLLASPHGSGGVAWRASGGLVITRDGADRPVPDAVLEATPAGWLPDGSLVVHGDDGSVAVVDGDEVTTVADDAVSVSVRAPLPPPPELPADIPLQAPA